MGLSDLCNKVLPFRLDNGTSRPADDTPMHIAKIMLEKNSVATLTNVLTDVDLTYPDIRNLITVVLRPLEYL
jgi:E3 ubiquitin-protein ligase HUWE1